MKGILAMTVEENATSRIIINPRSYTATLFSYRYHVWSYTFVHFAELFIQVSTKRGTGRKSYTIITHRRPTGETFIKIGFDFNQDGLHSESSLFFFFFFVSLLLRARLLLRQYGSTTMRPIVKNFSPSTSIL